MRQIIKIDLEKDLSEVDQFGFVDVNKAFQNGYVPGSNSSVTVDFDDCEDPSAIVGKPSDAFEAIRMQDSLIKGVQSYNKDASAGSSYKKDEN